MPCDEWTAKPLEPPDARGPREHVHRLWGRRVWLETMDEDEEALVLAYDPKHGHQPEV